MEHTPHFEQPMKDELIREIESHLEVIRIYEEEKEVAAELGKRDIAHIEEKMMKERAEMARKQKLLDEIK